MRNYLYFLKKWLFISLRIGIGLVVIKTGYDLASGNIAGKNSFSSDPITPVFLILLGLYIVFISLIKGCADDEQQDSDG
jgi:hypothetical protein